MKQGWVKTIRNWGVKLAALAALVSWQQAALAQFSTTTPRQGSTGQTGGSGFSGTTGTFAGTTGTFAGTTGTIGGTGTRTGTTGTGTSAVSTSNPFRTYYYNPLGMPLSGGTTMGTSGTTGTTSGGTSSGFLGSTTTGGVAGTTGTKAFGQPLYSTTTGTTGTTFGGTTGTTGTFGGTTGTTFGGTTGNFGGTTGTFGGISGTATTGTAGFTTTGQIRAPQFNTELGPTITPITGPRPTLQGDLRAVIQQSAALPSRDRIQVEMEGTVVVLRGKVASIRERRLAEGMVRMTPGVREVRNELTIGE